MPNRDRAVAAAGPLVVSKANPRYFSVRSLEQDGVVYLTGSHIWNNLHDGMGPGSDCGAERFDNEAYIAFLKERGHNFIRLWRWEQFKSQAAGGNFHLCMTPQPWQRTGPGRASDGKPKFDLSLFDDAYFERLRDRIAAAGRAGIYVAVMFFDGWALHLSPPPDNVAGHPFHAANNVNGIGISSIVDYQVLPLEPRVRATQEAYIRKVVDTVHDLPNVLYEVANESSGGGSIDRKFAEMLGLAEPPEWGDSTEWQYWVIDVVKRHEQKMKYDRHPIGITMQFPVRDQTKVNDPLFDSQAEWISPGFDEEGINPGDPTGRASRWFVDPPAADGRKVLITDTDHFAPGKGDALWAWKSFVRGSNPILMDFGLIGGLTPTTGDPSFASFEAARYAMGDTRRLAERMKLVDMEPHGELSSTGYGLANPGEEYLILQPGDTADPVSVTLESGSYRVEWFTVNGRETTDAGTVSAKDGKTSFAPPRSVLGPSVLYLKRSRR